MPGKVCEVTESHVVSLVWVRLHAQIAPGDGGPIAVVDRHAIDSDGHYTSCEALDPRISIIECRMCEGNKIGASEDVRIRRGVEDFPESALKKGGIGSYCLQASLDMLTFCGFVELIG